MFDKIIKSFICKNKRVKSVILNKNMLTNGCGRIKTKTKYEKAIV